MQFMEEVTNIEGKTRAEISANAEKEFHKIIFGGGVPMEYVQACADSMILGGRIAISLRDLSEEKHGK